MKKLIVFVMIWAIMYSIYKLVLIDVSSRYVAPWSNHDLSIVPIGYVLCSWVEGMGLFLVTAMFSNWICINLKWRRGKR